MTEQEKKMMTLLRKAGAFEIRGGSCEVHFDKEGSPTKIDVHRYFKLSTDHAIATLDK
jgi:hypothetical protein